MNVSLLRSAMSLLALTLWLGALASPLAAQDDSTAAGAEEVAATTTEEAPTDTAEPRPLEELRDEAAAMEASDLRAQLTETSAAFREALEQRDKAYDELLDADEGEKPLLEETYDSALASFNRVADEMQVYVNELDDRGDDVTAYRTQLVEARGIAADNLSTGVLLDLFEKWVKQGKDWLVEDGPSIIVKTVFFLIILLAFRMLGNLIARLVSKALHSSKLRVSSLLNEFAVGMTRKIVFVLGVLVALGSIGISVGPLLAGLGVLGFVVGFALQDTLANFASGIMLLLYRPFDVGDLIKAGGEMGKVEAMTMVSTSILTLDHQLVIVPNNTIWGSTITNVTAKPIRRVDMVFGIGYGDDIPKAEKVIAEVVAANEMVLKDPEPVVKVHNLGDSSVDFVVRPWCKTDDYWDVHWNITRAIKLRFDEENISIPFPQRDVHMYATDAAPAEASSSPQS